MTNNMCIIFIVLLLSPSSFAAKLSKNRLFRKCYRQITSQEMKLHHPLGKKVYDEELTAIEACMFLLKRNVFVDEKLDLETIKSSELVKEHIYSIEQESINILQTFQQLHQS